MTSSGAGPSNGVSWAMPPGPTSGTVMWTFEDVPAGSYFAAMTARVETVPSQLPGGSQPLAVLEDCTLTVFVTPVAP